MYQKKEKASDLFASDAVQFQNNEWEITD